MKMVIDTNVFVSSFFGGHPRRIIDLWREGRLEEEMGEDFYSRCR